MAVPPLPDPAAMFREMLGQWEAMANSLGGEVMKSGEFGRALQGANAAAMGAQAATHQMMERTLAAANMRSRAEIEDISARLARIEEAMQRIEGLLTAQAGVARPAR